MKYLSSSLLFLLLIAACQEKNSLPQDTPTVIDAKAATNSIITKYARGFKLTVIKDGYQLDIINPWPGADKTYSYKLKTNAKGIDEIQIPVTSIVATSTTHIPPLTLLGVEKSLVGFPSTDYISSPSVRDLIDAGNVEELGKNGEINLERTIQLQPNLVMGYGVEGGSTSQEKLKAARIPVLYNGDWTESHPLGKAEWIKLYGVLYDKSQEADSIFNEIELRYLNLKNQVKQLKKPRVIAGATYKDVWYLPYGNSWQGKVLADAGGNYVYSTTSGNGSLSYELETVLNSASEADYWIAPGQYTTYNKMLQDNRAYEKFKAFKDKQVYTFAKTVGAKGGVTYYEEAAMRPDLVLADLIKILHPSFSMDHELYFFKPLDE
ncbi:MAG: ABC transporter substrate-binding protein [Nonlabens sp.]